MTTDKKLIVNQKIKSTAIILAVFFGPYSFIYTWKKDSNHALIQIIFYTLGLLFGFGFLTVLYLPLLFWIVTLITVLSRGDNFYLNYYNSNIKNDVLKKEKIKNEKKEEDVNIIIAKHKIRR